MPTTDLETSIQQFMALGRQLQAAQPLTGETVLAELTAWYRSTRVDGAELDGDGDMLLLQWGATQPLELSEPTDLRSPDADSPEFAAEEFQYLDFTRQVFAAGNDEGAEEADFDDSAVQMSITLTYGPADGSEGGSNLWIHTPADIDRGSDEFRRVPFVASLLRQPAQKAAITVSHCG